jgi:hypothetical protein
MKTKTPLILIAAATATAIGGTTLANGAAAAPAQARAVEGDADVYGKRIRMQAETTSSTSRVIFRYGGERIRGRLVESDAEDRTRDWAATTRSLKSDRRPGRTVKFRVRACDGSGCTTTRFTEIVEWDD